MSPGPRATSIPSDTLIHQAIWSQYTNITDRQDRTLQTDKTGQTDRQTGQTKLR